MLEPIPMLVPAPLWSRLRFQLFRSKSRSIQIPEKNWNHSTVSSVSSCVRMRGIISSGLSAVRPSVRWSWPLSIRCGLGDDRQQLDKSSPFVFGTRTGHIWNVSVRTYPHFTQVTDKLPSKSETNEITFIFRLGGALQYRRDRVECVGNKEPARIV